MRSLDGAASSGATCSSGCGELLRANRGASTSYPHIMSSPDLAARFTALEKQLHNALEQARANYSHAGLKGDGVESAVRGFLRDHLPSRLDVGHGQIIDLAGNASGQLDVIITDEDEPFHYAEGQHGLYVVEGVTAVGEVKSRLTVASLVKAIDTGSRCRKLRYVHGVGDSIRTAPGNLERYYVSPPAFLVAIESVIAPDTLIARLRDAPRIGHILDDGAVSALGALDAVFIPGRGAAIDFGSGNEQLTYRLADGSTATGWVWQDSASPLVLLLTWLHSVMPRVQRWQSPILPYLTPAPHFTETAESIGQDGHSLEG